MVDLPHRKDSRTAVLMNDVHKRPDARHLIAAEGSVTWPIPYRSQSMAFLILPVYLRVPQGRTVMVFPWSSAFTVEWGTGKIVEFVDYQFRSPWAGVDFTKAGATIAASDVAMAQQAQTLATMYDELFDTMVLGGELPPFWHRAFRAQLAQQIDPCHHKFYKAIAPKFFARYLQ